jgi:hypothetical protein
MRRQKLSTVFRNLKLLESQQKVYQLLWASFCTSTLLCATSYILPTSWCELLWASVRCDIMYSTYMHWTWIPSYRKMLEEGNCQLQYVKKELQMLLATISCSFVYIGYFQIFFFSLVPTDSLYWTYTFSQSCSESAIVSWSCCQIKGAVVTAASCCKPLFILVLDTTSRTSEDECKW